MFFLKYIRKIISILILFFLFLGYNNVIKADDNQVRNYNIRTEIVHSDSYQKFIQENKEKLEKVYNLILSKIYNKNKEKSLELLGYGFYTPYEYKEKELENIKNLINFKKLLEGIVNKKYSSLKKTKLYTILYIINNLEIESEKEKENVILFYKEIEKSIINQETSNLDIISLIYNKDINKLLETTSKYYPYSYKEKEKYRQYINSLELLKNGYILKKEINNKNLGLTNDRIINSINNIVSLKIIKKQRKINILEKNPIINNEELSKINKNTIKISSNFGPRKLSRNKKGFHLGIDITFSDRAKDIYRNCIFRNNPDVKFFLEQSSFSNDKCINFDYNKNGKIDKGDYSYIYPNYKDLYNLIISLDLNNLKKQNGECYIGKNYSSKNKNHLVGYGYFLLCRVDNNIRNIYGHTNLSNNLIMLLSNKGYIDKVNNFKDIFYLSGITNGFYQTNYKTYDKKNISFNGPKLYRYTNSLNIINKDYYKINLDNLLKDSYNYINIQYGNTGNSFGAHIHYGLIYKLGEFISPIGDNSLLFNIVSQQLSYNISMKDNYYYFGYTNY